MVLRATQSGLWLSTLFCSTLVQASFWTVTSNYQIEPTTTTYTDGDSYAYTSYRIIKSDVTPTAVPATSTSYSRYYQDLEVVEAYYDAGAVPESDLEPVSTGFATRTRDAYTYFYMPVVYTAAPSCTSDFTFSTSVTVDIPSDVIPQITPTSSTTAEPYTYAGSTSQGDVTWFLTPSAAPWTSTEGYIYSYYIASCTTPYAWPTSYRSPYDDDDDDDDSSTYHSGRSYRYCYARYGGCHDFKVWIIIIASVIPSLFVLGFLESFLWFRRLMTGRSALRFGTVCWCLISLWVFCFTRNQDARSPEDQKLLQEQWKKIPEGTKFKLWWKWGFRHRYPTELLGQYSKTTVGISPEGPVIPPSVYGQPMMQQQGGLAMPPPVYMSQQAPGAAPGEQGKANEATVVVQPDPAHISHYAPENPPTVHTPQSGPENAPPKTNP